MPLLLSYAQNPAAHFEEILDELVSKHFGFKLKDDFLILAPYEEARQDIERALLKHSRLEGVLIGRSVLTLSSWIQNILFYSSEALPPASSYRMRRCLLSVLETFRPSLRPDPASQKNLIHELNRLDEISRLTGLAVRPEALRTLLGNWKSELERTYRAWSNSQARDAAFLLLRSGIRPGVQDVKDIYFVGFPYPDAALIEAIEAIRGCSPSLRIHLTLPPLDVMMDKEGLLGPALSRLQTWAETTPGLHPDNRPKILKRAYPTPLHEIRHSLREGSASAQRVLYLAPAQGSLRDELETELATNYFPEGLGGRIHPLESNAAYRALAELDVSPEETWAFEEFYSRLYPHLHELRLQAARSQDALTLRHLEGVFETLQDWSLVERLRPRRREASLWITEFRQEILELETPAGAALAKRFPLRNLDRAGLGRVERVYALGLNEGIYAPPPRPFQLAEDFVDTLSSHEKRILLDSACRLAIDTAVLSFSEVSLSGKTLQPAVLLSEESDLAPYETISDLPLWSSRRHPYFSENREREAARRNERECNLDSGNLQALGLHDFILRKIHARPLGATYLDEYAKCPWRFFAKWHLRLEEKRVEELELEPWQRGRFQHQILEKVLRGFLETFSRNEYPTPENVAGALESEFQVLADAMLSAEDYKEWPPVVVRDQLQRLKHQVKALLEEEHVHWNESKEKLFPRHLEWSFGRGGDPALSLALSDRLSIPLTGAIDRIDVSADGQTFLVLDYKSSSTEDMAREIREKRSFQLHVYLHAARTLLFPSARALGGLYWDLKKRKKNQGMVSVEAYRPFSGRPSQRGASFLEEETFVSVSQDLEQTLREILHRLLAGDYSLQPAACLGGRCEYSEICRYAKQPR